MGSHGIRDRVAIVGMACTPFGERFDTSFDDLMVTATDEAYESAGVAKEDVDAYWLGTATSGMSGITLARPMQLTGKPVTRVENYCATGSEALRNAAYAVASGAYDIAMAIGAEKIKDSGYSGNAAPPIPNDGTARTLTAAAMYSMVVPAYAKRYGVTEAEMREALAHIASKNHFNGARNPRAQFRKEVSEATVCAAAAGGRDARHLRLLGCGRRFSGGDRRPRGGRLQIHRQADLHQGAVVHRRQWQRAG